MKPAGGSFLFDAGPLHGNGGGAIFEPTLYPCAEEARCIMNTTARISHTYKLNPAQVIREDIGGQIMDRYDQGILADVLGPSGTYTRTIIDSVVVSGDSGKKRCYGHVHAPGASAASRNPIILSSINYDVAVDNVENFIRGSAATEWGGNTTLWSFLTRRHDPDEEAVRVSAELIEELQDSIDVSTLTHEMVGAPVGSSPRVGAFLAGSPNAMNRITEPLTTDGPVQMYVDGTSSSGVSAISMRTKGICCLALARMIQMVRPVELFAVNGVGVSQYGRPAQGMDKVQFRRDSFVKMHVSTAPFDVTSAARALSDPYVARGIGYNLARLNAGCPVGSSTHLPWPSAPLAGVLDVRPDRDVVIGAEHIDMGIGTRISALDWVKEQFTAWLKATGHAVAAQSIEEKWERRPPKQIVQDPKQARKR